MKKVMLLIFLCVIFIVSAVIWHGNSNVEINEYICKNEKIPENFQGFKIAQVSDLHNSKVGNVNDKTIKLLKKSNCNIIVMTGDMLDARNPDVELVVDFFREAKEIAPCYYISGNHEARIINDYNLLKEKLLEIGIAVLEDDVVEIEKDGQKINLIGLMDIGFYYTTSLNNQLKDILPNNDSFKILLSHRPELIDEYENVDLVFSGHAHGGQIRIPFIGGLFSPGEGFLPEFDKGLYKKGDVTMIVSAGIGNSLFPLRVNNNPEIVVCTLKGGK